MWPCNLSLNRRVAALENASRATWLAVDVGGAVPASGPHWAPPTRLVLNLATHFHRLRRTPLRHTNHPTDQLPRRLPMSALLRRVIPTVRALARAPSRCLAADAFDPLTWNASEHPVPSLSDAQVRIAVHRR